MVGGGTRESLGESMRRPQVTTGAASPAALRGGPPPAIPPRADTDLRARADICIGAPADGPKSRAFAVTPRLPPQERPPPPENSRHPTTLPGGAAPCRQNLQTPWQRRKALREPAAGTLGGNKRNKIYGTLTVPRRSWPSHRASTRPTASSSRRGAAVAAGYRPCSTCMPAEYQAWKTAQAQRRI